MITVANNWMVLLRENQGQVLAQMSALIDGAEATAKDACAMPGTPSLKHEHVSILKSIMILGCQPCQCMPSCTPSSPSHVNFLSGNTQLAISTQ